jgi:HD-like signal output (HDOD) protein
MYNQNKTSAIIPNQIALSAEQSGQIERLPPLSPFMSEMIDAYRHQQLATGIRRMEDVLRSTPDYCQRYIEIVMTEGLMEGPFHSLEETIEETFGPENSLQLLMAIDISLQQRRRGVNSRFCRYLWTHALMVGAMCSLLATECDPELEISRNRMFLSGLYHDIGFLVVAGELPDRFDTLDAAVRWESDEHSHDSEQRHHGAAHDEIGHTLALHLGLHQEVQLACRHHHNPHYKGTHFPYPNAILAIERLFSKEAGIEETDEIVPESLMQRLGIDSFSLHLSMRDLHQRSDELHRLAALFHA